jgi:hypothetical protein
LRRQASLGAWAQGLLRRGSLAHEPRQIILYGALRRLSLFILEALAHVGTAFRLCGDQERRHLPGGLLHFLRDLLITEIFQGFLLL